MVRRVRGYHYVIGANGRRRRVYSGGARRVATGRRKTTVGRSHARRDFAGDTIMGYGSYRKTSRSIGHKRGRRTGGSRVKMGNGGPHIRNSNGNFIIEHEEYLGDLNSSTAFSNTPFSINPGLTLAEGGFTNWLPNVAQQFEEWQPMGICLNSDQHLLMLYLEMHQILLLEQSVWLLIIMLQMLHLQTKFKWKII